MTNALAFTPADSTNVVNSFNGRKGTVTLTTADVRSVYSSASVLPSNIVVGASPFVYVNALTTDVDMYVMGGTVTLLEFSRDNANFFPVMPFVGLSPSDRIRITYTVAPTLTRIPR